MAPHWTKSYSINDDAKFLQEKELDFQKNLTIAQSYESADYNVKELKAISAKGKVKSEPVAVCQARNVLLLLLPTGEWLC